MKKLKLDIVIVCPAPSERRPAKERVDYATWAMYEDEQPSDSLQNNSLASISHKSPGPSLLSSRGSVLQRLENYDGNGGQLPSPSPRKPPSPWKSPSPVKVLSPLRLSSSDDTGTPASHTKSALVPLCVVCLSFVPNRLKLLQQNR